MNKDTVRDILQFESELNPAIWENIQKELHPKRKVGVWWWRGMMLALGLITAIILITIHPEQPDSNLPVELNYQPTNQENLKPPSGPAQEPKDAITVVNVQEYEADLSTAGNKVKGPESAVGTENSSTQVAENTSETNAISPGVQARDKSSSDSHAMPFEEDLTLVKEELTNPPTPVEEMHQAELWEASLIHTLEHDLLETDPIGCPKFGIRSEKTGPQTGFFAELLYGPGYAISSLQSLTDDMELLDERKASESVVYDHRLDARLFYQINQFEIGTGISLSRLHERFSLVQDSIGGWITVITIDSIPLSDGTFAVQLDTQRINRLGRLEQRKNNTTTQIDIPVILGYRIKQPKFDMNIRAGAIFNVLTNYKGTVLDTSMNAIDKSDSQQFKDNWGVSVFASVGITLPLAKQFSLTIQPSLYRTVNSIHTVINPIEQRYWRFNLMTGVRYDF